MLMYFAHGARRFDKNPEDVTIRHNWEFFIITSGFAAPYFGATQNPPLRNRTLWLMPPRRRYAWYGKGTRGERVIFHFSNVDESLQLLMANRDFLAIPLDRDDVAQILKIADDVAPYYQRLSFLSSLHFTKALVDLSLLIATKQMPRDESIVNLTTKNQMLARRALAFFKSQLPRRPLVEEAAVSVGVSTTHLRRIFLEVFHEPPKHLFLMAQLEYAKSLAAGGDMLINEVAERSGFSSAPDLCRAFRKYHHTTFHQWRMQLADIKTPPHVRGSVAEPPSRTA